MADEAERLFGEEINITTEGIRCLGRVLAMKKSGNHGSGSGVKCAPDYPEPE